MKGGTIMYNIVGFKKNSGKLDNGKDWSNYTLYCHKDSHDEKVVGFEVQTIKVPTNVLQSAFPVPNDMLGADVNFCFDVRSYNGVDKVVVTDISVL